MTSEKEEEIFNILMSMQESQSNFQVAVMQSLATVQTYALDNHEALRRHDVRIAKLAEWARALERKNPHSIRPPAVTLPDDSIEFSGFGTKIKATGALPARIMVVGVLLALMAGAAYTIGHYSGRPALAQEKVK